MFNTLIIITILAIIPPANACIAFSSLRLADILMADEIFVGEVTDYKLYKPRKDRDLSEYGVITFKVIDNITGKSDSEIKEVYWHNSTFGMPKKLNANKYLVAITNNSQPRLRGPSATIFPSQRKDIASLLQAPCSSPFMLEPTKENINKVKTLLSTKDDKYNGKTSTFELQSNGDIYINTKPCSDSVGRTKLDGVNHLVDDVEQISSKFLRINGKIFDAYAAEFQRHNIKKTHNISNNIVEKEFRVVDKEKQYFTDGLNYYYKKYYPTSRACLNNSRKKSSIKLSEFKLESPTEAKLYLSQKNNILTSDDSYTLFAELNEKLYYKSKSGKFVEVPGVNPKTLRNIGNTYLSRFFTDGQHLIFQGEVIDSDFDSFKQIKAGKKETFYYKIGDYIYRLYTSTNTSLYGAALSKTDFDAETFEVLDPSDSFSDRVYRDKNYIYSHKKNWEVVKIARK